MLTLQTTKKISNKGNCLEKKNITMVKQMDLQHT